MSQRDITRLGVMARWEPDAAGRLREAAMELFLERGYDQTTVADIAERAGVTSRTFFRHFTDKRGVLFGGGELLETAIEDAVAAAPPSASPMALVEAALVAVSGVIGTRRSWSSRRQLVINQHPELQERELVKMARLADVLASALEQRGVAPRPARLAAEAGVTAFRVGFDRWVTGVGRARLASVVSGVLEDLRALA